LFFGKIDGGNFLEFAEPDEERGGEEYQKLTTPRRIFVPYLIFQSAALLHSALTGSVISALLSFVLMGYDISEEDIRTRDEENLSIGV